MHFPDGIWVYGDKSFTGRCALEKHEAKTFFALLRTIYPNMGAIAIHVRNEGKRSKWQGYQQKQEGMVPGASDIIIPGYPTFICELKRRNHRLSELPQKEEDYLRACKTAGCFVSIALGADAAMKAVEKWMEHSRNIAIERIAAKPKDIGMVR